MDPNKKPDRDPGEVQAAKQFLKDALHGMAGLRGRSWDRARPERAPEQAKRDDDFATRDTDPDLTTSYLSPTRGDKLPHRR